MLTGKPQTLLQPHRFVDMDYLHHIKGIDENLGRLLDALDRALAVVRYFWGADVSEPRPAFALSMAWYGPAELRNGRILFANNTLEKMMFRFS